MSCPSCEIADCSTVVSAEDVMRVLVDESERQAERAAIAANERADRLRVESDSEWWATYRAALTGRCAYSMPYSPEALQAAVPAFYTDTEAHESATAIADMAHGKRGE